MLQMWRRTRFLRDGKGPDISASGLELKNIGRPAIISILVRDQTLIAGRRFRSARAPDWGRQGRVAKSRVKAVRFIRA